MMQSRRTRIVVGCLALTVAVSTTACSQRDREKSDSTQADSTSPPGAARLAQRATDTPATAASTAPACLVTDSSMGPIQIGMTLDEARTAMPGAIFERGFDGDGVASVGIIQGVDTLMNLTADGDDSDVIDWTRRIAFMETFSPVCRTAEGTHPGALVVDVEKRLGAVTKIVMSEIESREFITFERQPAGITFRLDYTGRFDGSRETTRFAPEGKIFSISISR